MEVASGCASYYCWCPAEGEGAAGEGKAATAQFKKTKREKTMAVWEIVLFIVIVAGVYPLAGILGIRSGNKHHINFQQEEYDGREGLTVYQPKEQ